MKKELSEKAKKIILSMQQNELNESIIYENIAKFAKGAENRETLLRLAKEEKAHYEIWKGYTGKECKPNRLKIFWYTALARTLGFTFAAKWMEKGEEGAQETYALLEEEVPESAKIRADEEAHEAALLEMLDEESLRYVGSMVLGLSDALVELTGSIVGFTFAMQNTRQVALSGLIVGISATFSMASSEFLSAKSEGRKDAMKACCYTGFAYLVTVVLMVLPYLLFGPSAYLPALLTMLGIIIAIIAGFTFYTSIAQDQPFGSRFLEMAGISLSVAVISFVVGLLAKQFLGVEI
jgi:VIT1/CCC1 family predicted Fe2+/Mn2+ transporter